jgi:hypothetical protein
MGARTTDVIPRFACFTENRSRMPTTALKPGGPKRPDLRNAIADGKR